MGRTTSATIDPESYDEETGMKNHQLDKELNKLSLKRLSDWVMLLLIFSIMVTVGNYISTGESWQVTFIGMLILSVISYVSYLFERLLPRHIYIHGLHSLDCKEIQPVNPKGNLHWTFTGRTNAEAEAPILWPPDVKSCLIWKDLDAGKDWKWE